MSTRRSATSKSATPAAKPAGAAKKSATHSSKKQKAVAMEIDSGAEQEEEKKEAEAVEKKVKGQTKNKKGAAAASSSAAAAPSPASSSSSSSSAAAAHPLFSSLPYEHAIPSFPPLLLRFRLPGPGLLVVLRSGRGGSAGVQAGLGGVQGFCQVHRGGQCESSERDRGVERE